MEIFWDDDNGPNLYYVYMYFAELQLLKPNQSRLFKLYLNDELLIKDDIVVDYLSENVVRTIIPSSFRDYKLIMSEGSTLPPILNAIEIYKVMNFTQLTTEQADGNIYEHSSFCIFSFFFISKYSLPYPLISSLKLMPLNPLSIIMGLLKTGKGIHVLLQHLSGKDSTAVMMLQTLQESHGCEYHSLGMVPFICKLG